MVPLLPEEILVLILEDFALPVLDAIYLPLSAARWYDWAYYQRECLTTLSNACLASKSLHKLAWPILYRHFTNGSLDRKAKKRDKLDTARFLQTLCTKPEYGLALRSLSIAPWVSIEAMDPSMLFGAFQRDATLVDLFQWRARGFWLGDDDKTYVSPDEPSSDGTLLPDLLRLLEMGLPEAHMAMLLLLCPAIKELDVRPPLEVKSSVIARLLKAIFKGTVSKCYQTTEVPEPIHDFEQEESDYHMAQMFGALWPEQKMQKLPMFSHLEKLVLHGSAIPISGSGSDSLKNLLAALPSLRILSIMTLPSGHTNASTNVTTGIRFTRLRTLVLGQSQLSSSEVSTMLEYCPNLTALEVNWKMDCNNFVGSNITHSSKRDWRVRLGDIADAIALHAPRMRSLKLTTAHLRDQHPSPEHPYTIGKALQQLAHLEELQIDHHAIYGPGSSVSTTSLKEVIPRSLKLLGIGPSAMHATETDDDGVDDNFQPTDSWQKRHIDDLNQLLQDKFFMKLCQLDLTLGESSTRTHIEKDAISKHGWEIVDDNAEVWAFRLRNSGRAEVSGPKYVLTDPKRRFSDW